MISWSAQDDAALDDMWRKNVKPEVIAEKLGRTVCSVMVRAARRVLGRRAKSGRKKKIPTE